MKDRFKDQIGSRRWLPAAGGPASLVQKLLLTQPAYSECDEWVGVIRCRCNPFVPLERRKLFFYSQTKSISVSGHVMKSCDFSRRSVVMRLFWTPWTCQGRHEPDAVGVRTCCISHHRPSCPASLFPSPSPPLLPTTLDLAQEWPSTLPLQSAVGF